MRELQADVERRQRLLNRRAARVAEQLAGLMEPGMHAHRIGVSLHAFNVDGRVCLATGYLDREDETYRYRYAVLCGGEAARRALRTGQLDPGASDAPGPDRRIAFAEYAEYIDFLDRLPRYLGDVSHCLEQRLGEAERGAATVTASRRQISALTRRQAPPAAGSQ